MTDRRHDFTEFLTGGNRKMRKSALGFATAGGFEMPSISKVELEKENSSIMYAKVPKTVYKGSGFKFSRVQALAAALADETKTTVS